MWTRRAAFKYFYKYTVFHVVLENNTTLDPLWGHCGGESKIVSSFLIDDDYLNFLDAKTRPKDSKQLTAYLKADA